jgi:GNAT superfamily N-acetyltransferase
MTITHPSAGALAASLLSDPFYLAITADFEDQPALRSHVLERYFAYSLAEADRTGRLAVAEDPAMGAAAWILPRTAAIDDIECSAKAAFLASTLGVKGFSNYQKIVENMAPLAQQLMAKDAWYLSILGIAPSAQGTGIGARLLQGTLYEARRLGVDCYLETYTPRNHAFYRRLGFNDAGSAVEPVTGREYVLMLRRG